MPCWAHWCTWRLKQAALLTMAWTPLWEPDKDEPTASVGWSVHLCLKSLTHPLAECALISLWISWAHKYLHCKIYCLLPTNCTVTRQMGVVTEVGSGCLSWAMRMEWERRWPMAHQALTTQLGGWCPALRGRHSNDVLRQCYQTRPLRLCLDPNRRKMMKTIWVTCKFPRVCNTVINHLRLAQSHLSSPTDYITDEVLHKRTLPQDSYRQIWWTKGGNFHTNTIDTFVLKLEIKIC